MIKYLVSFIVISLFTVVGYSSAEDTVPPYVLWDNNSYPDGSYVWTDSIIGFGLADDSSGVATTSIRATLDNINQPITIENINGQYRITCKITTPNIPMYNKAMLIHIEASDNAGNEMKTFERRVSVSSRTLSLENVIAYPNPWQPGSGSDYIYFSPLPYDVEIQIFDVSGERVREVCLSLSKGIWEWDLRDNEGDGVAPGLYIYMVKDRERHTTTTGKILIMR
ncbi:T9SS type A sorting domain-containing protein [Candidatus Desantisbacteria bacterium]|nr:T9SS type A sorting domain-containing protein [Candidatus Desantisbacteria bacterium]